jgi:RND family efflux transporter MFP subunit
MHNKIMPMAALLLALAATGAQAQTSGPDDHICQVTASERVEVASPVTGIIESMLVERGDTVTRGQVLLQLRADLEKADLALAQARATASSVLKSKETTLAFADRKLERNTDLRNRNLISANDLDQLKTERDNAALDVESARDAQRIASLEVEKARALLDLRTIRSPTDGIVAERNLPPGNVVGERPILVLMKTDPLNIEVSLPASLFGRIAPGEKYPVKFDVPGIEAQDVEVKLVDALIDSASNTFNVRLVLHNAGNRVPAGAKCHVQFPKS